MHTEQTCACTRRLEVGTWQEAASNTHTEQRMDRKRLGFSSMSFPYTPNPRYTDTCSSFSLWCFLGNESIPCIVIWVTVISFSHDSIPCIELGCNPLGLQTGFDLRYRSMAETYDCPQPTARIRYLISNQDGNILGIESQFHVLQLQPRFDTFGFNPG